MTCPLTLSELQCVYACKMHEMTSKCKVKSYNMTILQNTNGVHQTLTAIMLAMLPRCKRSSHINRKYFVDASVIIVPDDNLVFWRNIVISCTSLEEGRDFSIIGNANIDTWPLKCKPLFYIMSYTTTKYLMKGLQFRRLIVDNSEKCVRTLNKIPNALHTHLLARDFRLLCGNNCIGARYKYIEGEFEHHVDPLMKSVIIGN